MTCGSGPKTPSRAAMAAGRQPAQYSGTQCTSSEGVRSLLGKDGWYAHDLPLASVHPFRESWWCGMV